MEHGDEIFDAEDDATLTEDRGEEEGSEHDEWDDDEDDGETANAPPPLEGASMCTEQCDANGARTVLAETVYEPSFLRPPFDAVRADNSKPLEFWVLDLRASHTSTYMSKERKLVDGKDINDAFQVCRIFAFGLTAEGVSVCCCFRGFQPWIYIEVPQHWNDSHVNEWLRDAVAPSCRRSDARRVLRSISSVEVVRDRTNLFGYWGKRTWTLARLTFETSFARSQVVEALRQSPVCGAVPAHPDGQAGLARQPYHHFRLFDSQASPVEQFVASTNVWPSHWLRLPAGTYTMHNPIVMRPEMRRSRCQIDIDAPHSAVTLLADRADIPPLLIESWDLEVVRGPRDTLFPDADNAGDEIINVGTVVWRFGDKQAAYRCVHVQRPTCNLDPEHLDINAYADEAKLLDAYLTFSTEAVDADIRLAFNCLTFDSPYWNTRNLRHLKERMGEGNPDRGAFEYGRLRGQRTTCSAGFAGKKDGTGVLSTGSKAHGKRVQYTIDMPGRVQVDLFKYASEAWKMPRGLNFIAEKKIGRRKMDLDHIAINRNYDAGPHERGKTAQYCGVDCELPIEILLKQEVIVKEIEESRLHRVPLDVIFNKKQLARGYAVMVFEAYKSNMVIPDNVKQFINDAATFTLLYDEPREGALVLPPVRDLHTEPIVTLDFSSLYPSIMRAHDLCYSRLIVDPSVTVAPGDEVTVVPIQSLRDLSVTYSVRWVRTPVTPLLARILNTLTDARKVAKNIMEAAKEAGDMSRATIYNMRQLALKVSANSVYGFTGATVGKLPCSAITATVTWYGRQGLAITRDAALALVPGSTVIYGDTDSIMVRLNRGNDAQAFHDAFVTGEMLSAEISKKFRPPMKLLFEKVSFPYLLFGKVRSFRVPCMYSSFILQKCYAAMVYEKETDKGKFKQSGTASVRGDKISFVRRLTGEIIQSVMKENSADGARRLLTDNLQALVDGRIDVEELALSKKLSKELDDYVRGTAAAKKNLQLDPKELQAMRQKSRALFGVEKEAFAGGKAGTKKADVPMEEDTSSLPEAVRVALEMKARDPGTAPRGGSIVSYVIVLDKHDVKRPVDVEWFKTHRGDYRLHLVHYIKNLIQESLGKVIDLPRFGKDPYRLFERFVREAQGKMSGQNSIARFLRPALPAPPPPPAADGTAVTPVASTRGNQDGDVVMDAPTPPPSGAMIDAASGSGTKRAAGSSLDDHIPLSRAKVQRLKKEKEREWKDVARATHRTYEQVKAEAQAPKTTILKWFSQAAKSETK